MIRSRCTIAIALVALSCGSDGGGGGAPDATVIDFDERALLANLAEFIIVPTYEQFAAEAADMTAGVDAYCAALGGADEATALAAAQADWRAAMAVWQRAEMIQIGPASSAGGALRDGIYSWPIVSACAVDQDVMLARTEPDTYDIATRLPNRRGLDALEYALFAPSLDSACPPQSTPAGWDELADADKRAARCGFAALAAADLEQQAVALVDAWSPSGGNFVGTLVDSEDPHAAVDSVFGALFYLDGKTKDEKLAQPTGIQSNSCGTVDAACAAELESQFARHSRENVAANVLGFRQLFLGERAGDGVDDIGFDDFLRAAGADALADTMVGAIDGAGAAVDAVPGTLDDTLESDYAAVVTAHDRIKDITDRLKTDVPPTLGLTIPSEAGGDAD